MIGLVGGVGSGKSAVSQIMSGLGCVVSCSDDIAHDALKDSAILAAITRRWGSTVLDTNGAVDRARLADIVFFSEPDRLFLESLIHPWIARRREAAFAAAPPGTRALVIDAPLLLEAGLRDACDTVIFVDCPLETRQARVAATRGWSAEELARREAAQWPLDRKRSLADHVIRNDGDPASLRAQVRAVLDEVSPACGEPGSPGPAR